MDFGTLVCSNIIPLQSQGQCCASKKNVWKNKMQRRNIFFIRCFAVKVIFFFTATLYGSNEWQKNKE
jgi:hypothetical protein